MIMFDSENQVQEYAIILSKRNHEHLGQIRTVTDIVSKINLNSANEISFTVYKYIDFENKITEPLWDEIVDFKYVYVKELNEYYEIVVDNNDEESVYKSITGTSACECELSQSYVYGLEINSEADIAREDYKNPTVFYDPLHPDESLLHRALYKLPQYSIKHVDTSLAKIQRTFSSDGEDVYSFLVNTVGEEIGCLFTFDTVDRSISVYDLKTVCIDCGHRGEFSDKCPKCGSTDLQYFGEDTTIYVDTENLADNITFSTDTESVKNCFKLEAGDDNMTAAVINCNPNGSAYIYYFSDEQKREMRADLVEKMNDYDKLVASYDKEYSEVMANMYEAIDKIVYYTSAMMPTRENEETDAKKEAAKLTEENMSPMGLPKVTKSTSVATVNAALKQYVKVFVKSGYFKVEINESDFEYVGTDEFENNYGYWYGSFKVTNYSDEEDTAISQAIRVKVYDLYQTFLEQKIEKKLANYKDEEGSIFDVLSIKDLEKFKEALTYYGLNRLTSFYDAIQGVLDIMIEEDQANENADMYEVLYIPYRDKLDACQTEIDKREATIDEWGTKLDTAETRQREIQDALDFEAYLGTDLYKEFCCYRREDKYSNENYISDGFENNEIFERAREFIDAAKDELIKSGEYQHTITATLFNLLAMKEFDPLKDKFNVGNFIRIGIDEKVYRLRLTSYQITFENIQSIDVEFSDVTKNKNGSSDLASILSKSSSMASTYDAVVNQVKNSKEQTDRVKNWVARGLDATAMKIVNNADNQNITIGETGLLARRKDDFSEEYEDCQVKLLSTGVYTTDNGWRSVKSAIGKSYMANPETGELEQVFGIVAENIVGQLILGQKLGIYSSDGSKEMSFDNYGLVLNTKDNGEGHYTKIFDIQKDGVSQLYVDSDGNIVLANKQMIEIVESVDRIEADYADIENLYVSNATIEKLLAKYATIENLEAVNAKIENLDVTKLEAEFGKFKELVANKAEIEELIAGNITVMGTIKAQKAEIEEIISNKIDVGELEAYKATIEKLFALYASIEYLEANYIKAQQIEAEYAKIKELEAVKGSFETLKAELAEIDKLIADKANIKDLEAVNATIENLKAGFAEIEKLVADKISVKELEAELAKIKTLIAEEIKAVNATIENLDAKYATIENLNATNAKIENLEADNVVIKGDLTANKADIGELNAQVANIESIMSGNIGTGLLQAIHITVKNAMIDDAVIRDLIAAKIDVNDLKAGEISTDKFTIKSDDGGVQLVGSTMQFKDKNDVVRVQIGQDAKGNFTFAIFDEQGTGTLIDHNGIHEGAIPNGIIKDDMVANDANISGDKLNINSVVEKINEDGTTTISSSKVWIDEENQSIGAKFDKIEESIGNTSTDLGNFITQINKELDGIQGQIDGSIQTYFYEYAPTNDNIPASEWNTTDLKNNHLGDLFYDTITGYCYRWQVAENAYSWQRITDVDVTKALADAAKAQDTADNKRRVFVVTPIPPYDVGDLWSQGTDGELMKCKVAKTASQTYDVADWEKAAKYTDDSKANEVGNKLTNLQTDFKIEQGKIEALIKETTIDNGDGTTTSLKDKYMDTVATVDGIKTTVANVQTDMESMSSDMAEIGIKADEIFGRVSSIGGQNLFYYAGKEWLVKNDTETLMFLGCYKEATDNDMEGRDVTLSFECLTTDTTGGTFDICFFSDDKTKLTILKADTPVSEIKDGRYSYTFEFPATPPLPSGTEDDPSMFTMVVRNTNITGDFQIRKGMIQYGRLATEWQPPTDNVVDSLAEVSIEADKISWLVKSGTDESNFEMTPRAINLVANDINLNGKVTIGGLSKEVQDKINAGLISGIGGRNLIYHTDFRKDQTDNWTPFNDAVIEMSDGYMKVTNSIANGGVYSKGGRGFTKDLEYTLSFVAYGEGNLSYNFIMSSEGNEPLGSSVTLSETPQKYTIQFKPKKDFPANSTIMIGLNKTGAWYFKDMMVELGSTASEYQAAIEDISGIIDGWTGDEISEGVTEINGGALKNESIETNKLSVYDIFSEGSAVMNIINAQEINANRITTGKLKSDLIDAYGLKILKKNSEIETFSISEDGDLKIRGDLESYNYHAGKTGLSIRSNGDVELNDATVRGSVVTNDGGITSGGGSGTNLLLNSSLAKNLDNWSATGWSNTIMDGYECAKVSGELNKTKNLLQSILPRIKNDGTSMYTVSAWVKMVDYVAGTNNPYVNLYFSGTYDNEGTSNWIGATHISGDQAIYNKSNQGWVKLVWTVQFAQVLTGLNFTVYARDFTGDVYIRNIKIEEGDVATEWSASPQDNIKEVRIWVGSSYADRELAPFKVLSDGSVEAVKGKFSGTLSGRLDIGNISIVDPNEFAGGDALLTVQNGDNGIKVVQIRDTDSSSFAQNIEITDTFYHKQITLKKDGYGIFNGGVTTGSTEITSNKIALNNFELSSDDNGYVFKSPQVSIGTKNQTGNLNVYGDVTVDNAVKIKKEINFGDKVVCTVSENGIDFNFIN